MKRLLWLVVLIPIIGKAQDKGIHFERGLSWAQVKTKAKAENKYIFVDCYATWCGPCKAMDKDVYPDERVGEFINDNFISVKIQLDTSKQDNDEVKKWHSAARAIQKQYKVTAFPTYLFFSPDANIVHRAVGLKNVANFIALAKDATNPRKQYYSLIENYQRGIKDYSAMDYLATTAKDLGEKDLANKIARDYFDKYLFKLKEEELFTKKNLEFIYSFDNIITSKDKGFDLFYRHGSKIDSILEFNGLSRFVTDYIITREEIDPIVKNATKNSPTPDWNELARRLDDKYGVGYAESFVLEAKVGFYEKTENWKEYLKYGIKRVEKKGLDTRNFNINDFFNINYTAWMVFLHSNNKKEINRAIIWMEALDMASTSQSGWLDTYANLLYKVRRKKEAIRWEEKALKIAPENRDIQEAFEKMKKAHQPSGNSVGTR